MAIAVVQINYEAPCALHVLPFDIMLYLSNLKRDKSASFDSLVSCMHIASKVQCTLSIFFIFLFNQFWHLYFDNLD